jgi:cyclopropane fatty-acyl-phospholipid synthase-like methyltransferase
MGTSHPESRPWSIEKILQSGAEYILDIGAGSGTYSDALKSAGFSGKIDALEIWQPYIDKFDLHSKYRKVYQADVRMFDDFSYDVVIFGDILEHMTKEQALDVWKKVSFQADCALIAIPIIHYHQGEIDGNPYEHHVKDDWSHEEVLSSFSNIVDSWQGEIVGAYWAVFW